MPSGRTRLAAVIGDPVRHSLSPALHNAAFAATGLDWVFLAFPVPDGGAADALAAMRTFGLGGLSVTMPHKAAVAAAVDECSPSAATLGAVNCVVPRRGALQGHNTDGAGFLDALRAEGHDVAGRRCVVFGAGGAARAVILALAGAGAAEVVVVNRTAARAEEAAALAAGRGRSGRAEEVDGADLVVQATPVGMAGAAPGSLPCDPDRLGAGQIVVDLVYEPLDTPLLVAARARGATVQDGLGMLLHQAAHAFSLWTGESAPVAVMEAAARSALEERRAEGR
jgi:shikimate dehydrogenase